jgi:hypothetical protein
MSKKIQIAKIITLALLASVGIFLLLAWKFTLNSIPKSIEIVFSTPIAQTFTTYAVVVLIASYFLPNLFLRQQIVLLKKQGTVENLGKNITDEKIADIYFTNFIFTVALRESLAALGLVAAISTQSLSFSFVFFGLAAVGILLHWPSTNKWREHIERLLF